MEVERLARLETKAKVLYSTPGYVNTGLFHAQQAKDIESVR